MGLHGMQVACVAFAVFLLYIWTEGLEGFLKAFLQTDQKNGLYQWGRGLLRDEIGTKRREEFCVLCLLS